MVSKIETLEAVISEDEEILWHGKVPKNLLLVFLIKSVIYLIITIYWFTFLETLVTKSTAESSIFHLILLQWIIWTIILVFSVTLFLLNVVNFNVYHKVVYYITDKQEFDVIHIKDWFIQKSYDNYRRIMLQDIEKIIIRPLRKKKGTLAHIDFHSKQILNNQDMFYFSIRKLKENQSMYKEKGKIITLSNKKVFERLKPELRITGTAHRFCFVENYEKVAEILRNLLPEKVVLEYSIKELLKVII